MNDDRITNNLKQVLYSNTMLDNSFPEMNAYRDFMFLGNNTPETENTKSDKKPQPEKGQPEKGQPEKNQPERNQPEKPQPENADKQNKNNNKKDKEDDLDEMDGGTKRRTHKYRVYKNRHTRKHLF
jgi:outer membrane biosynthesis protein TonB